MRLRAISTAIMAVFILFASSQAWAANPAFALTFWFKPPFNTGTAMPPVLYLDVCAAPNCSAIIRSIPMKCAMQNVAPNTIIVTQCTANAVLRKLFPDPNLALLGNPVNLRVSSNNRASQVFTFSGGQPALPEMIYNFVITPGIGGFSVAPG